MSLYSRFLARRIYKGLKTCPACEFVFVAAINHWPCRGSELRARPIAGYRIAGGIPRDRSGEEHKARKPDCFPSLLKLVLFLSPLTPVIRLCENNVRGVVNNEMNRVCKSLLMSSQIVDSP